MTTVEQQQAIICYGLHGEVAVTGYTGVLVGLSVLGSDVTEEFVEMPFGVAAGAVDASAVPDAADHGFSPLSITETPQMIGGVVGP